MSADKQEITRVERSKEAARKTYDRLSGWYDLLAGSSERKFTTIGIRKLNVQSGERVLEIGFGTGESLIELAGHVGPKGKVYGVDISEGMLEIARKKLMNRGILGRVDLQCRDAAPLPYPDDFFDAIFLSFVLELFDTPEIPRVLAECKRALRDHGRLGVVALARQDTLPVKIYERFHRSFPAAIDCRPIYVRESITMAGFQIQGAIERRMWGLPVEIVVAQTD